MLAEFHDFFLLATALFRAMVPFENVTATALPAMNPLVCPVYTEHSHKVNVTKRFRAEYCLDWLGHKQGSARLISNATSQPVSEGEYDTDRLSGEFRYFDEKGRVEYVSLYRDGTLIAQQFTVNGLQNALADTNETRRAQGKGPVEVLDEHTIVFSTVLPWSVSHLVDDDTLETIRVRLSEKAEMCAIFHLDPSVSIDTVQSRLITPDGTILGTVSVHNDECGSHKDPATED